MVVIYDLRSDPGFSERAEKLNATLRQFPDSEYMLTIGPLGSRMFWSAVDGGMIPIETTEGEVLSCGPREDYFGECWDTLVLETERGRVECAPYGDLSLYAIGARVRYRSIRVVFGIDSPALPTSWQADLDVVLWY